jgi:hypothetical protein
MIDLQHSKPFKKPAEAGFFFEQGTIPAINSSLISGKPKSGGHHVYKKIPHHYVGCIDNHHSIGV